MPYPTWTAGRRITAADLTAMQWHTVEQGGSGLVVNNSVALQNTAIIIPVVANSVVRYRVLGNFGADAAADCRVNWSLPTGATMTRWCAGPGSTATGGPSNFTTTHWRRLTEAVDAVYGGSGAGSNVFFVEEGEITVGANAGSATMRFAQGTANASDTILTSQTYVDYLRIG